MLMLGFESSAKAASVALYKDGKFLSEYTQISGLTHSRTLLPMAQDMLKNADLSVKDVDVFAVTVGPGSFTGLRIGIATVKGLCWGGDKPCVGVSTLEALAYNAIDLDGIICPCMDARRNQVYNGIFRAENNEITRITEDRPIELEKLAQEIEAYSDENIYLIGDGAELAYKFFEGKKIKCRLCSEAIRWQSAKSVCRAALNKEPISAEELNPVYHRLSQAERERLERLEKEAGK